MEAVFRADASVQIGSGHVMRCLTLADALRERRVASQFLVSAASGGIVKYIEDRGFACAQIAPTDEAQDAELTLEWLQRRSAPAQLLIVDHYQLGIQWQRRLAARVRLLAAVDDAPHRPHACSLLLDQNYSHNHAAYRTLTPPGCRLLLGPQYALLRPEFKAARKAIQTPGAGAQRFLVFFGGADEHNVTELALDGLRAARSEVSADVVIGALNPHQARLRKKLSDMPRMQLHVQTERMAQLMADADIYLGAGGSITWERLCVGLPGITISVADNQTELLAPLAKDGFVEHLGHFKTLTPEQIAAAIDSVVDDPERRRSMAERGQSLVDGDGAARTANILIESASAA